MFMINHPTAIATDGQQTIDDFVELAQKAQKAFVDGKLHPIAYQELPAERRESRAVAEITEAYQEQVGTKLAAGMFPDFRGRMLALVQLYPQASAFETLERHNPTHPIFCIDEADRTELRLIIMNFCMAVCLPEVSLDNPKDRAALRPLFILGYNLAAIAFAFHLGDDKETKWLTELNGSLFRSGVMNP